MNDFFNNWTSLWQQNMNKPFKDTPFNNMGSMGNMGNVEQWQQQFTEFNPMSFWQNALSENDLVHNLTQPWLQNSQKNFFGFSPLRQFLLQDVDFANMLANPLIEQLHKLVDSKQSEQNVKETLRKLSEYWYQHSNVAFDRNIEMLEWQKNTLQMLLEKGQFDYLDNDLVRHVKQYFQNILNLIQQSINLIRVFDGFDSELTNRFIDKTVTSDISLEDSKELFNLWCQLFDEYYKEYVFSEPYQQHFADYSSALAQLKQGQQDIIDLYVTQMGLPSRQLMDSLTKRVHQHHKQLRKMTRTATEEDQVKEAEFQQLQVTVTTLTDRIGQLEAQIENLQAQASLLINNQATAESKSELEPETKSAPRAKKATKKSSVKATTSKTTS